MKRDMELVRKILLAMEADERGPEPMYPQIPGYDKDTVLHHIYIMGTGDLIATSCEAWSDKRPRRASAQDIKWAGYEFLNASRDETVWEEAKATVAGAGKDLSSVTIGVLQGILTAIIARSMGLQ